MKLRLHAGEGDWYSLLDNGAMHFEGNRSAMTSYLKKHTKYSASKIESLINRSLTDWLDVTTNEQKIDKIRAIIKEEILKILK
jgi:hypothetical protein